MCVSSTKQRLQGQDCVTCSLFSMKLFHWPWCENLRINHLHKYESSICKPSAFLSRKIFSSSLCVAVRMNCNVNWLSRWYCSLQELSFFIDYVMNRSQSEAKLTVCTNLNIIDYLKRCSLWAVYFEKKHSYIKGCNLKWSHSPPDVIFLFTLELCFI